MRDFEALQRRLQADAEVLIPQWLPGGKRRGHEWVCGDINGNPGESFSVNLLTGMWADFADPDCRGGDYCSMYARQQTLTQVEAYDILEGANRPANSLKSYRINGSDIAPTVLHRPPHAEFDKGMFKHPRHGAPSKFWIYYDREGPLYATARYDHETGKDVIPWIWDTAKWVMKGPPKPRPLYGLDRLAEMPTAPALLVEGEKAADAAQRFLPKRACMTWCGGTGQYRTANWEPLRGLGVTLWPDADEAGRKAMAGIAALLIQMDCKVKVIDTKTLPDKWDLADAEAEGWTMARVITFAREFGKDISAPAAQPIQTVERERSPVKAVVGRNNTLPPPGNQVYEERPSAGSLQSLWSDLQLQCKGNGRPFASESNVKILAKFWRMNVWFDDFAKRVMCDGFSWTEKQTSMLHHKIQVEAGMPDVKSGTVFEGIVMLAHQQPRNPAREWLEGLQWDGEERLPEMLHYGLGAKQGPYSAAVGRCFMVGMVARVLQPGCKVDCLPILEGPQGARKSSALKVIGGDYYAEIHESMNSKDFYIAIAGKMLCELGELNSLRRADAERVKGIISNPSDTFRAPYAKVAEDHPRTCVFAGTTNSDDYNTDETGARRFWPVRCGSIDLHWLEIHREQLFAEAVHRFKAGEPWWDVPEKEAKMQRDARYEEDPWADKIEPYLMGRDEINANTILEDVLGIKSADVTIADKKRVSRVLQVRGYKTTVLRTEGVSRRRWVKKED